jgi:hypothetical protein
VGSRTERQSGDKGTDPSEQQQRAKGLVT